METPALLLLFAASFVNAIAPGPVVVLTFGRAARSGLRAGTTVSLGVLLADLLLVALALGVALGAFALSASGFAAMKWLGIAVLFALALSCVRAADRPPGAAAPPVRRDGVAGLMLGLTSPYNLVFYLALLPQVLPGPPEAGAALAIAATTLAAIALAQAAVVAFALGCRGVPGFGGRWIDYAAAATLVVVAGTAALLAGGPRRPAGRRGGGQWTLTGENSFWRATTKAWARSGTRASSSPVGAWMAKRWSSVVWAWISSGRSAVRTPRT